MPADALPVPTEVHSLGTLGLEGIIPAGATTFTLTFGPYTDALGVNLAAPLTGKLLPVDPSTGKRTKVVHLTSGQVILPNAIPITITAGSASVGPIPHTGQTSMTPFYYRVEWDVSSGSRSVSPGNLTFVAPAAAGSTVDFDLLVTAPALPDVGVPVVDAVIASLLDDTSSATYAKVVALINARTGFGRGA